MAMRPPLHLADPAAEPERLARWALEQVRT